MSSGGKIAVQFPIRFADIIFAEVLDPNGQNPKTRRVVVLTPDIELVAGFPIVVAGVTGTLPDPLTGDIAYSPFTMIIQGRWAVRHRKLDAPYRLKIAKAKPIRFP